MKYDAFKRRCAAALLAVCLLLLCAMPALAAGTGIDLSRTGSVHIRLYDRQNDVAVRGGKLTLYKVVDVVQRGADLRFAYSGAFADCSIPLGDLTDSSLPGQLQAYLPRTAAGTTQAVGEDGNVTFENLPLGLYLVVQTKASRGYAAINSFLVSLPYAQGDNWRYDVDATPKVGTLLPDPEPEEPDTPGKPSEPSQPTVPTEPSEPDIPNLPETPFEPEQPVSPGSPDAPVTPGNAENPSAPESPDAPANPGDSLLTGRPDTATLPQTGQLNWPIPVLAFSGMLLFAVGWVLDKKELAQ